MRVVNIHEAKTHFSKLINAVLEGEEIVIAKSGKPVVKLAVYSEKSESRKGGQLAGMFDIPKDFDEPLPDDIINLFYHGEDE